VNGERPARITIARHGETAWSRAGRFQGLADIGLSRRGRAQAHQLAQSLVGDYSAVWSSDLRRARATAAPIAARFAVSVRIDRRLREIDVGSWEGLTRSEVACRWPAEYAAWLIDPTLDTCSRESFASLRSRCDAVASALCVGAQQGAVIAVTHGTSGIVLMASLLAKSAREVAETVPLPTGGMVHLDRMENGEWTAWSPDGG
jgi:probable phosphoglycerate mutase